MLAAILCPLNARSVTPPVVIGSNPGSGGGGGWSGRFEFSTRSVETRVIGPRRVLKNTNLVLGKDAAALFADALFERPILQGLDFDAIERARIMYDSRRRTESDEDDEEAISLLLQ